MKFLKVVGKTLQLSIAFFLALGALMLVTGASKMIGEYQKLWVYEGGIHSDGPGIFDEVDVEVSGSNRGLLQRSVTTNSSKRMVLCLPDNGVPFCVEDDDSVEPLSILGRILGTSKPVLAAGAVPPGRAAKIAARVAWNKEAKDNHDPLGGWQPRMLKCEQALGIAPME